MAPGSNLHVVSQLRQLIYYHLDCNLTRNALFFAGRLTAYEPRSSEAAYLLSLCYLKIGQLSAAYETSRSSGSRGTHLGCSYTFAQACLGLGKYQEGALALEKSKGLWAGKSGWGKHNESRRQYLPDAAAVYNMQGKLWQAHAEHQKATECYAEALKLNPFMWDAFTALCDLGNNVLIPNVFKMTPEMVSVMSEPSHGQTALGVLDESPPNALSQSNTNIQVPNQLPSANDPFSISKNRVNGEVKNNTAGSALFEKFNSSKNLMTPPVTAENAVDDTPTVNGIMDPTFFTGKGVGNEPPLAPTRKARGLPGMGLDFGAEAPPKMRSNTSMRSKSRTNLHSEEHDESNLSRSSTTTTGSTELKRTISGKSAHSTAATAASKPSSTASADLGAPQRKSVRLLNQLRPQSGKFAAPGAGGSLREERELRKAKAPSSKARSTNTFNVGRVVSGNRKHDPMDVDSKEHRAQSGVSSQTNPHPAISKAPSSDASKDMEAVRWLLELCSKLGTGYFALSHYQCEDALRVFQAMPPSQRETPWVLALMGRSYYEQASYAEAEKLFARVRTLSPFRMEDMEFYSTTLWQRKNEIDLAFLSHELIELDRQSPQAWCAVGNSFSLQRDHDQALKCFKRATQLDPFFAYAYTLQGHEHMANEEYDKAMLAYRASITADNRHYNAWYGLARVFEKQGKYKPAEQHYRTASQINPTNAVLITCIGTMLEKQKNPKAALVKYDEACQIAEKGTLWRYRKARVLEKLGQPERALVELKIIKDIAPDDANIHFSLGNVYKRLGDKADAIKHYTMANNLDPKASAHIKEAMEELDDECEDEDADM